MTSELSPLPSFRLSTLLLALGIMLVCSGGAYGLVPVSVGVSCGNAFSKTSEPLLTSAGEEACAQARSGRQAHTWGLIVPGLAGIGLAVAAMSGEKLHGRRESDAAEVGDAAAA
jgi:hypothetical protein